MCVVAGEYTKGKNARNKLGPYIACAEFRSPWRFRRTSRHRSPSRHRSLFHSLRARLMSANWSFFLQFPEGPSTHYLRLLISKPIYGMVVGSRKPQWVLGGSGIVDPAGFALSTGDTQNDNYELRL